MTLHTPSLDDRRFQDIVDQAKTLIPRFCPEWTDHNVSDPGITLVELFAWMTELLLYRVNQVPDKMYVKFLELIGVRLDPPRPANARVTFYLSAPQPAAVTIPEGTEVATVRTETSPAIVFSTEADLTIRPPVPVAALTRQAGGDGSAAWTVHDLRRLGLPGERIPVFSASPSAGDAFYVGYEGDHSDHVLALVLVCDVAGGAGVDPRNPPLIWEVWQGGVVPDARWARCEVEYDGTGGFNQAGEIVLHVPLMQPRELNGQAAYWLRCRLLDVPSNGSTYKVTPEIESLCVEARGGTVSARNAVTFTDEVLGRSDGSAGQTFRLSNAPVLSRDPARDYLLVDIPGGTTESWTEVSDFADSGPEDRHFTLDNLDGTITLGPALLQPEGGMYRFGALPPRGSLLRFTRYQSGGGAAGNLPARLLSVPKSSIPYVARVSNRTAALGGRDAQSLEDAKLRAPQVLRTRTRAVTAGDYEHHALEVPGVARACCIAPGDHPGDPAVPPPGHVRVVVLPDAVGIDGPIPAERLTLSAEVHSAVLARLNERRVLGTSVEVRGAGLLWVSVQAIVRGAANAAARPNDAVQRRAEAALYRYINPYTGGPHGNGWPFGRELHVSELYAVLQALPSVEFVEQVRVAVRDGAAAAPQPITGAVQVPRGCVLCSDEHHVA